MPRGQREDESGTEQRDDQHTQTLGRYESQSGSSGADLGVIAACTRRRSTLPLMYIGLGVFAVLAVVCVIAGAMTMKRRRDDYEDGDGGMSEAEFRKYEGFDD